MIVDLGRVEASEFASRKENGEQIGAGLGQLVEEKRAAGDLGKNGEQARAGRWLQHDVVRRDRSRRYRREAQRNGSRELLKRLALFRATGVCRKEAGDFRECGKPCCRRRGFAEKRASVFAEEQDGRDLAGVVGRFPVPGAGGVGCAERRFHRGAQDRGVDALAAFEMTEKVMGGRNDSGRMGNGHDRSGRGRHDVHEGSLQESRNGKARTALSLDHPDSSRPGGPLTLKSRR
ncbi:hypothetical protein [Methylosinus sp. Sm6]|uniref:hypothetical protein n=1 Tax=Methylosinus sp. Sm6 TaxID=2866948 RepID=UPI00210228FE|nr:hypothetical protein [Methylosinus sp. Sm6]